MFSYENALNYMFSKNQDQIEILDTMPGTGPPFFQK
ncbi:hypothetical protein Pan54_52940 [Rubinisphaera italica]|uniref:Uncharacterized protein n=1 Tax=Rubinisphaera italica TaxID=2527969 RepID=A0A5C5XNJ8_9PLAN|nr:hypothetical protein Pan54_52940 [Rubinisphaera italica]